MTGAGGPPRGLVGARALVTGASSGIGAALVDALTDAGARVVAAGRDRGALHAVADRTGAIPLAAELTDPGAADRLIADAAARLGGLDLLVCNAGVGWAGPLDAMTAAEIDHLVAVNLTVPLQLCRAALPELRRAASPPPDRAVSAELDRSPAARRPAIVVVSSIAGLLGVADEAAYSATKAGLAGLADALRQELRSSGIDVVLVAPGVVDTAFFARRNVGYQRARPRPIPARRVAHAIVTAVEKGRPVVIVPRWLTFPVWLQGAAPGLFRRLAGRFGSSGTRVGPCRHRR